MSDFYFFSVFSAQDTEESTLKMHQTTGNLFSNNW